MRQSEAFKILGVEAGASADDIKKAYKKLAMKHHPDKNPGDKGAEDRFKQINEAYRIASGEEGAGGTDQEDLFRAFAEQFGFSFDEHTSKFESQSVRHKATPQPRPGARPIRLNDINVGVVKVTLEELLIERKLTRRLYVQACCQDCLGSTTLWQPCGDCKQTGKVVRSVQTMMGLIREASDCPFCRGTGWRRQSSCSTCNNQLIYKKDKKLIFSLPKQFNFRDELHFAGAGNESWNAPNGNIRLSLDMSVCYDDKGLSKKEREALESILFLKFS